MLLLWAASTLFWWAFAFMPLSATSPEWLATARLVCFGPMESGLPARDGVILLVLAPASFLGAIVALWGRDLPASLRAAARAQTGRAVLTLVLVAVAVEAVWVGARWHAAQPVLTFDLTRRDLALELPADYPRATTRAPDFTLIDQHGAPVSPAALRGRPVVVTFVFAHCTTICPLVVDSLKQAIAAPGVEVLLVTVDPWRDTVSALPTLARQWSLPTGFHVLSSREIDEVTRVAAAFRVPVQRDERTGDVTHPGLVFVLDRQGRIAYAFNNPPPAWIREGLRRVG